MGYIASNEGVDHINAYSKSKTKLGLLLSNFQYVDLIIDGIEFKSIEAYWYYLKTGDLSIANKSGLDAKLYGKTLESKFPVDEAFKAKIRAATKQKIELLPELKSLLKTTLLPITHYYVNENGKSTEPIEDWWINMLNELKKEVQLEDNQFSLFMRKNR